jgi:hypothetical protein
MLLFLGSSFGLGLQPPCLSLLLGFGLVHSPALFRRGPWLIQRFDDLSTEALYLLSDGGRVNIEMAQGTPIYVLTPSWSRERDHCATWPVPSGNRNYTIGKRVVSTKGRFTSENVRIRIQFTGPPSA